MLPYKPQMYKNAQLTFRNHTAVYIIKGGTAWQEGGWLCDSIMFVDTERRIEVPQYTVHGETVS